MMPGTPGKAAPETSNPRAFSCTRCHVPGIPYARCGSFAAIGTPSAACAPETAHAFEPGFTYAPWLAGNKKFTFAGSDDCASSVPFAKSKFEESVKSRNITRPINMESVMVHGRGS